MQTYKEVYVKSVTERIAEEGKCAAVLDFESIPIGTFTEPEIFMWNANEYNARAAYIKSHYKNEPEKKLKGGKIAIFIKRVIKKLTRFYVKPLVEEQNDFNENVAFALSMLGDYVQKLPEADDLSDLIESAQTAVLREKQLRIELNDMENKIKTLMETSRENG